MTVQERILRCRLIEKANRNPGACARLGLVTEKKTGTKNVCKTKIKA